MTFSSGLVKRLLLIFLLAFSLVSPKTVITQNTVTDNDIAIIEVLLRQVALKTVPKGACKDITPCVIFIGQSIEPFLPQAKGHNRKEGKAIKLPTTNHDFITLAGHTIPGEIISQLRSRSNESLSLPPPSVGSPLIGFEATKTQNTKTALRKPRGIGTVRVSLPGYTHDGTVAGVYIHGFYSFLGPSDIVDPSLRDGYLGVKSFFALMTLTNRSWEINWLEVVESNSVIGTVGSTDFEKQNKNRLSRTIKSS